MQQEIIGFKAGLTTSVTQKRFNSDVPVMGVLTRENIRQSKVRLAHTEKTWLVEAELAFRLKQDISSLSRLNRKLEEVVEAVAPAIELPSIHFRQIDQLTSNDIIATNVGANVIVLGEFIPIEEANINTVQVVLTENNDVIAASQTAALQNRENALRWLIRKSYLEGYRLKKGYIYLTGSLMAPVVMRQTYYKAEFSQLGTVDFSLR